MLTLTIDYRHPPPVLETLKHHLKHALRPFELYRTYGVNFINLLESSRHTTKEYKDCPIHRVW